MNNTKRNNNYRGKTFGVVINPKIEGESIDWKNLSQLEVEEKLNELDFIGKSCLTLALNKLEFTNVNKNKSVIEDFEGQLELGSKTNIPHYQLALKTDTICSRPQVLKALEESINGHISVNVQHNYVNMKEYCMKDTIFISEKYSGRIFKKQWMESFLDKKPNLKEINENPYPWQKLLKDQVLSNKPEDRIVDWLVDPVGNTGKSSFARAYCSDENSEAILMKIDNLDRMELSLINKISNYRDQYYKDPKIIFFDFPRASSMTQVMQATALMEDAKSGYLETNFGGKHKNIKICNVHVVVLANTAPDLSVLSVDRWRLWRLGGEDYGNIIWPCKTTPYLKKYNKSNKSSLWCIKVTNYLPSDIVSMKQFKDVKLPTDWFNTCHKTDDHAEVFGVSTQYTNDVCSLPLETPNYIRILEFRFLENMNNKNIITFNNYS
jgi:hypothetical protein